jgi:hypothetical protein
VIGCYALAGLLVITLVGCGDDQPDAEPRGASSSPKSPASDATAPSESPTAGSSPTTKPLSRFEDEPPVKKARSFARAVARSINTRDAKLEQARRLMTPHGRQVLPNTIDKEIGLYYPGPLPFTPVRIIDQGRRTVVRACVWAAGWGQKRSTKLPAEKRRIEPLDFVLVKRAGRWRVDDVLVTSADCGAVSVRGVGW